MENLLKDLKWLLFDSDNAWKIWLLTLIIIGLISGQITIDIHLGGSSFE
jgi:hypothetical protein